MRLKNLRFAGGIATVISLVAGQAFAQSKTKAQSEDVLTSSYKVSHYKAPRTVDGQPDLQGVWSNNSATPLQRPKELANREFLTEQELTGLKREADKLFQNGASDAAFGDSVFNAALANYLGKQKGFTSRDTLTGDYSSIWTVNRDWTNRTSRIIDPADGRLPAMTPEAMKAAAARRGNGDEGQYIVKRPNSYEDVSLGVRCITMGAPRTGAGYNSYLQIFQTAKTVVIQEEMLHNDRIVSLDGSPHPPANVTFWNGDSRGHWEGDTLVIDTTNYRQDPKRHVIEHLQRTAENYVTWTVTYDEPATYVKPYTEEIPLRHSDDAMYEYACHEGNYGMKGIMSGARAEDAAEAAAKTGSAGLK
jgi:hypothetical protein